MKKYEKSRDFSSEIIDSMGALLLVLDANGKNSPR